MGAVSNGGDEGVRERSGSSHVGRVKKGGGTMSERQPGEATGLVGVAAWVTLAVLCLLYQPLGAQACTGDCDGDAEVSVAELMHGVNIALGTTEVVTCPVFDVNVNGQVSVSELITAVGNALDECPTPVATAGIVFSGEANRLNAYDPSAGFAKQTVIERASLDPENGKDINGQLCFTAGPDGTRQFIAGEDTGQGEPGILQGWGFFRLDGDEVGGFSAPQIGKLTPTYQGGDDNAENLGCGFLSDGRLLTADVGNQRAGPGTGQLIIWFPPLDEPDPRFCKLDVEIGTAQFIAVDEQDHVYLTNARIGPGVYLYTGPFPTSDDAAGGCGRIDGTGAPLVDEGMVTKERFIADANIPTPSGIVLKPGGGLYVASVLNGVIAEYDSDGQFIRRVLEPPLRSTLPRPGGAPAGLGLASDGTLYYADIGLAMGPRGPGPGRDLGTVRRIRFVNDEPQHPEILDTGLNFPDGIGIVE